MGEFSDKYWLKLVHYFYIFRKSVTMDILSLKVKTMSRSDRFLVPGS